MNPKLLQLLLEALSNEVGIEVETPDPERLRQQLYAARRSDPDFQVLSLVIPSTRSNVLWIVKRGSLRERG